MSFPTLACYPNDRSFGSQNYDDLGADFFDQFLTYRPVANETPDCNAISDSAFLDSSTTDPSSDDPSSNSLDSEGRNQLHHDHWRNEPWTIPDSTVLNHSADGKHLYSELTGRAAISDSELLSLEGINLYSPQINVLASSSLPSSLPSSPSPATGSLPRKRNRIVRCLSKKLKKAAGSIDLNFRSPNGTSSSSPKTTRKQHTDLWDQKLEPFDFEKPSLSLSPPPSSRVPKAFDQLACDEGTQHNPTIGSNNGFHSHFDKELSLYETPLSTPILESEGSRRTSSQRHASDNAPFPPTPTMETSPNRWSQLPGSVEYKAANGHPLIYSAEGDAPLWWNHAATSPMAQPSPTTYHINPQRATKTLAMQLHSDVSYGANENSYMPNMGGGLMIQMPGGSPQQSLVVQSSLRQHQGYFPTHQPHLLPQPRHSEALSRQEQYSGPIRRVRPGPSDSESPSPKSSPTFHVRKRRTTKKSKSSTPRTPALGGAVDFVNFTPDDSRKILTGVAPSGSSKTKARREREAMERRKKLSQAAVRAVREAGGDIQSLVEQGLLV